MLLYRRMASPSISVGLKVFKSVMWEKKKIVYLYSLWMTNTTTTTIDGTEQSLSTGNKLSCAKLKSIKCMTMSFTMRLV